MEELEQEMTEYFMQVGRLQGVEETFLKIFSVLYLEPDEITLEELAKKTGYSLASISTKLKIFEQSGFIKKKSKPGSKRIYVSCEKDTLTLLKKHLIFKQERIIAMSKQRVPEILRKYENKAKSERDKQKIKIVEDYYKQVQKEEKLIPQILDLINKQ